MKQEDRLLNPLGFQVTNYRRDAETASDVQLAPNPPPAVVQPAYEGPLADVPAGQSPTDSSLAQTPANGVDRKQTRAGAAQ
jgi:type IV secretion system protein VirB8